MPIPSSLNPLGTVVKRYPTEGLILDLDYRYSGEGLGENQNSNMGTRGLWADISGSGNHAQIIGAAYTAESGWNGGLATDGAHCYGQVAEASLTEGDFTLFLKFYHNVNDLPVGNGRPFFKGSGSDTFALNLNRSGNYMNVDIAGSPSGLIAGLPTAGIISVAFTVNRAGRKIIGYLDGLKKMELNANTNFADYKYTGNMRLGTQTPTNTSYKGIFKNVLLYNRVLGAAEITKIQEVLG